MWKLLKGCEVESGLGQEALEEAGLVLHPPEPGDIQLLLAQLPDTPGRPRTAQAAGVAILAAGPLVAVAGQAGAGAGQSGASAAPHSLDLPGVGGELSGLGVVTAGNATGARLVPVSGWPQRAAGPTLRLRAG